jgi:hypothetical protein
MATIKERRRVDKERQKRFRERMLNEGKKPVVAYLSEEARERLRQQRNSYRMSLSEFVEMAIMGVKPKLIRRKKKEK